MSRAALRRGAARPHGQIRQSQLITTFGPGSMLDLPNYSVLVAGLEFWSAGGEEVVEPRLIEKLCQLLGVPTLTLRTPPPVAQATRKKPGLENSGSSPDANKISMF